MIVYSINSLDSFKLIGYIFWHSIIQDETNDSLMLNQNIDNDEQWCQWLRFQPCEYVIQNSFDNTLSLDSLVRMAHQ
ncbi:unnamed protein product [Adineta steineri]|uniref:Uncharacterized protein n=1 Tax=Adineta steineri TaxID=433720 RepID=A0A819CCA8_9BILA|nr:unnamed protein product [Adineta steineri]CAF1399789.1 unnamed protein product [Adineta steineri]CAF1418518.1 unnamed protein product [Adineta steineri]CAF3817194.1 unnamed protein product [Adineta steineri]CAF3829201.1 unnamed protein product [Adineta steineri]